jgi:hypothetical protein
LATQVFYNGYLSVNSVDLSDHVKSMSLEYKAEELDDTCMGDTVRTRMGGLKDWSLTVTFAQDYVAGEVDATLWPLIGAAAWAIIIKPNGGTTSGTNPKWTGTAILLDYTPIAGTVGDYATTDVTFLPGTVLTRATSDA